MKHQAPQIEDIIARLQKTQHQQTIVLNPGATEAQIERYERVWGGTLPDDLKKLYRFCNGLLQVEDDLTLHPLEDLIDHDEFEKPMEDFIMFEWLMYCDIWLIGVDRVVENNYIVYNYGNDMVILTNSLAVFLERVIDFGVVGLLRWTEESTGKR